MTRNLTALATVLAVALGLAAPADAAKRFTIRGAGYGHGVGMSQYGAMGYASHGWDYRRILGHFYTDTAIGVLDEPRTVRVLIQTTSTASFRGATAAAGRRLSPGRTYTVRSRAGNQVQLATARGRPIVTAPAPLRVTGARPITVLGTSGLQRVNGSYRGALEFRPSSSLGGVNVINALDVDEYVLGVIPLEVPASWPAEALKAQAVAARTYALTTNKNGPGFDHYSTTASQVYGGVAAEHPSTNAAAAATKGQLVTYQGTPVATYFFSTSGGRTEDVEKSGLGTTALPWLRSVEDKYDSVSPKHRWTVRMSMASAGAKLRGLYRGRFRGVRVITRGSSPRVVAADVVGTAGRTRVTGPTLRARLGLFDSWAYFTSIATGKAPAPLSAKVSAATPVVARVPAVAGLKGTVFPGRKGATVKVQRRFHGRWVAAGAATTTRGGRYHAGVAAAGTYRVVVRGAAGPAVTVGT